MAPIPKLVKKWGRERWLLDLRSLDAGRLYFESEEDAKRAVARKLTGGKRFGRLAVDLLLEDRQRFWAIESRLAAKGATIEQLVERSHRPAALKPIG
jgi:hypothetical protein